MRVALYTRVSTEEQRKHGYSLADQVRELRAYAEREGHEVVEEVSDEGLSGADPYRPGLARILELAKGRRVDLVLATKRNRFFRDLYLRRGFEKDLKKYRVKLKALDDMDNPIADGMMDLLSEEQRREIARETRRGRMQRARSGRVAASTPPYGFNFNHDNTNFVVDGACAPVVRRIFGMLAAGNSMNGVKNALQQDGVPAPRGGKRWSRASIRQMVLDDVYKPHAPEELEGLVEEGLLTRSVLDGLEPDVSHGVWWFNRLQVEPYYEDNRKRRAFTTTPRSERVAVPVPDLGVPRGYVEEARRRIRDNRAPSNAGRRFWELSGGILLCKCGRRMATHTVKRKEGRGFYYVCGLRRSNHDKCEHGAKYHPAEQIEGRVRAFVQWLLRNPETMRARVMEQVAEERRALKAPEREIRRYKEQLTSLGRKRSGHLDQQAEGIITMAELREKLDAIDADRKAIERELGRFEGRERHVKELDGYAARVDEFLGDLPDLVHGSGRLGEKHRPQRYRSLYEDLGFRVVAHRDGLLRVTWAFGEVGLLRVESDRSPNRHATRHFHATEHPLVQSFEPGEDWIWCYVDEIVMTPR